MKIKISHIIGLLIVAAFPVLHQACDEKEPYNFNEIEPIILSLSGNTSVVAHGNPDFPESYSVPHRGGSTFTWSIEGHTGTITPDPNYGSRVKIVFAQSTVAKTCTLKVVEKTLGGKVSPEFTRVINLLPFCSFNADNFTGLYNCLEPGYGDYDVRFTKINANTIRCDNFWDSGWVVDYTFNGLPDEKVTLVTTQIGIYRITGEGKYNGCTNSFWVDYKIVNVNTGATVDQNRHTFTKK